MTEPAPSATSPPAAPPRYSLWALAAVPVSFFACLPFAATAMILAAVGLMQIRRSARSGRTMRGKGAASSAIAVAICAILVQAIGLAWWHVRIRVPMQEGPRDALVQGLGGEVEVFRGAFAEPGRGTPEEAEAFLDALRSRYGRLRSFAPDTIAPVSEEAGAPALPIIPYVAAFEKETVRMRGVFNTFRPPEGILPQPVLRWARLEVLDDERGHLVYPSERLSWEAPP